jgi:hypothetical protein
MSAPSRSPLAATVHVVDSDDTSRGASLLTSQLSTSNPDFTLSGLKSHLVQNLVKKPKVLYPRQCPSLHPFSAPVALFSRLSYLH